MTFFMCIFDVEKKKKDLPYGNILSEQFCEILQCHRCQKRS